MRRSGKVGDSTSRWWRRARADVWITPRWTLGVTGSTDLRERRNVATGLLVTLRL